MDREPAESLGIAELAERAGVTPRTVRFYVAEGLLPAPAGSGQQRTYSHDHLLRLLAIKRLKAAYLPLDEIRRRLTGLATAELERLATADDGQPLNSALAYVSALLSGSPAGRWSESAEPAALLAAPAPAPDPDGTGPARTPAASTWTRVTLAPGVELHYQTSSDARRRAAIDQLIRQAAKLLGPAAPSSREES